MIVIETRRGPFRVADVYYARPGEAQVLCRNLALNQILHLRQTPELLAVGPFLARYRPWQALHLDLSCDLDDLFGAMDRTCRYQVRKADRIRDRIQIRRNDAAACRDFLALHNDLAALKKHTEVLSEHRFETTRPFTDVLVAYFDGRPVCSHVMIRDETLRRVGLIWSASTRLNGDDAPGFVSSLNRWLHWYEMCLYKSEDMKAYDFGNAGTDTASQAAVTKFKLSFGGTCVIEHDYIVGRITGRLALRLLSAIRRVRLAE